MATHLSVNQLNGHEFEQTQGDSEGQGSLVGFLSMGSQRVRHDLVTEQQQQPILNPLSGQMS